MRLWVSTLGSAPHVLRPVYFYFGCADESVSTNYYAIGGDCRWEDLRFRIEYDLGFFDIVPPTRAWQRAYLTGVYIFSSVPGKCGRALAREDVVYEGDVLRLSRHPQPAYMHAYIPQLWWDLLRDDALLRRRRDAETARAAHHARHTALAAAARGEEEKIAHLQRAVEHSSVAAAAADSDREDSAIIQRLQVMGVQHASEYARVWDESKQSIVFQPHHWFRCDLCGAKGAHFMDNCPTRHGVSASATATLCRTVVAIKGVPVLLQAHLT